jgi:hypothetical protein
VMPPVRTPSDLYLIGLEFSHLTFGNQRANFVGELVSVGPISGVRPGYSGVVDPDRSDSAGLILVRASRFLLHSGFRMDWRTAAPPKK